VLTIIVGAVFCRWMQFVSFFY